MAVGSHAHSIVESDLIACYDCDLLHHYKTIPVGQTAKCRRCGAVLYQNKANSIERTYALSITALVFFILANTFPFLELNLEGQTVPSTLMSGVLELYKQEMELLAVLVFFTSIFAPLLQVFGLIYVLAPLRFGRVLPFSIQVFRMLRQLEPWGMMEVFMLGILVSVVKLNTEADIVAGVAVWSFAALILALAWAASSLDPKLIWDRLGRAHG